MQEEITFYTGKESGNSTKLDDFNEVEAISTPKKYTPAPALVSAVNMAIMMGKPLLITGEPGTGKTMLAQSLSWELHGDGFEPFTFTAKTTSKARDLFYTYDAIKHFHDSNIKDGEKAALRESEEQERYRVMRSAENQAAENQNEEDEMKSFIKPGYQEYIYLSALGKAIIKGDEDKKRYVVLIDELDKAPRDFPNDLLAEIESMTFKIDETNQVFKGNKKYTPIVIITSNSERLLPEPFLRRCFYFNIEFPSPAQLKEILVNRLKGAKINGKDPVLLSNDFALDQTIDFFYQIRDLKPKKDPATAEFLFWMEFLIGRGFNPEAIRSKELGYFESLKPAEIDLLRLSSSILIKHKEDFKKVFEKFPKLKLES